MHTERSKALFQEARQYIPGGVNSPVRAFRAVGGQPLFVERGEGAYLYDADGNRFIDYVGSWGPLILGHAHPEVVAALTEVIKAGTSYGAPTEKETALARLITQIMPAIEMVRFVNSGTEATMSALRLARAFTGREKIIKFEGGYHGHADMLLVSAGSGVMTLGAPDSPGVTRGAIANTLSVAYNDLAAVEHALTSFPQEIAAIIIEPVAGNMGLVQPEPGFLPGLRDLTKKYGALLIFDEVMTGFRVAYGGVQGLYGIAPDITCLGKIIGGGLPVGAYGGRRDIMALVSPSGPVYQAGTLSGNPLAMTAGITQLTILGRPGIYEALEQKSAQLEAGIAAASRASGVPIYQTRAGSMFCAFFTSEPVTDYMSAKKSDTVQFGRFFQKMLEGGIYLAPSQFESGFISLAHTETDIQHTIKAAKAAFAEVALSYNR